MQKKLEKENTIHYYFVCLLFSLIKNINGKFNFKDADDALLAKKAIFIIFLLYDFHHNNFIYIFSLYRKRTAKRRRRRILETKNRNVMV